MAAGPIQPLLDTPLHITSAANQLLLLGIVVFLLLASSRVSLPGEATPRRDVRILLVGRGLRCFCLSCTANVPAIFFGPPNGLPPGLVVVLFLAALAGARGLLQRLLLALLRRRDGPADGAAVSGPRPRGFLDLLLPTPVSSAAGGPGDPSSSTPAASEEARWTPKRSLRLAAARIVLASLTLNVTENVSALVLGLGLGHLSLTGEGDEDADVGQSAAAMERRGVRLLLLLEADPPPPCSSPPPPPTLSSRLGSFFGTVLFGGRREAKKAGLRRGPQSGPGERRDRADELLRRADEVGAGAGMLAAGLIVLAVQGGFFGALGLGPGVGDACRGVFSACIVVALSLRVLYSGLSPCLEEVPEEVQEEQDEEADDDEWEEEEDGYEGAAARKRGRETLLGPLSSPFSKTCFLPTRGHPSPFSSKSFFFPSSGPPPPLVLDDGVIRLLLRAGFAGAVDGLLAPPVLVLFLATEFPGVEAGVIVLALAGARLARTLSRRLGRRTERDTSGHSRHSHDADPARGRRQSGGVSKACLPLLASAALAAALANVPPGAFPVAALVLLLRGVCQGLGADWSARWWLRPTSVVGGRGGGVAASGSPLSSPSPRCSRRRRTAAGDARMLGLAMGIAVAEVCFSSLPGPEASSGEGGEVYPEGRSFGRRQAPLLLTAAFEALLSCAALCDALGGKKVAMARETEDSRISRPPDIRRAVPATGATSVSGGGIVASSIDVEDAEIIARQQLPQQAVENRSGSPSSSLSLSTPLLGPSDERLLASTTRRETSHHA